jgi:hypothetical protein
MSFRRHRYRREDDIKMNIRKTECEGTKWIQLAPDIISFYVTNQTH